MGAGFWFVGGLARGGDVGAGFEIVVGGKAIGAEAEVVDAAVDGGFLLVALVAQFLVGF